MLTGDLVRASRRKGRVYPRYIDTEDEHLLYVAERLGDVLTNASDCAPSWRRDAIDEALDDLVASKHDPLLFRGLRKLLADRCSFETTTEVPPETIRARLFALAAETPQRRSPGRPWSETRAALIRTVADELDITTEQLSESLFADLSARQRITRFKSIEPEPLLGRYNLALAQAVLIRATRMTVTLGPAPVGAYRQLFRALKFHQLIHRIVRKDGDTGDTVIEVDGPMSMFANGNRYGVAMARFLPTLALMARWELRADVLWGKAREPSEFRLDHKQGLRSHLKRKGQYITQEQELFEDRFAKKPGAWDMTRATDLLDAGGGEVVVPDVQFRHEAGQVGYLEIVGFWRAGSLERRLTQLAEPGLERLVLAVSKRMRGDRAQELLEHPRVIWFGQVISPTKVRDALKGLDP